MKKLIVFIFHVLFAMCVCTADVIPDGGPYVEMINEIAWTFIIKNGEAWVGEGGYSSERAVPISTGGQLVIPSYVRGCPVVGISDFAFHSCSQIESILIPEGVRTIGDAVFIGCNRLQEVYIPSTVREIIISAEGNPFASCSALEAIEVSGDNTVYKSEDGVLYTKSGDGVLKVPETRRSITITEPVETVFCGAFHGWCLEKIILPSSVKLIQNYAFSSCERLASVVIPSSVAKVGRYAFNGCHNLESLTFLGDCPLKENYGWSVSPSATFFITSGSQGWESDTPGRWNEHLISYLTAEQEFLVRAASVTSLEDLENFNVFLRDSSFCFSDRELRDCVNAILNCISTDNGYIDSYWLYLLREILAFPRMRGVLTSYESADILKRVLPVALNCTDRDLAEHQYALDNRLIEYSGLVSLLGGSMSEEWRVSVMKASLDSLEKYEGEQMGLFAASQLFRALFPKLSDEERLAVFERVIAIAATYDDMVESYCGLEDWTKALFEDASIDFKKSIVGTLEERSKASRNSVFFSVMIRLCVDWFGSIEACGFSLDDCVFAISRFELLDEHLIGNLSEVMCGYDDYTMQKIIVGIAQSVRCSITTECIIRDFTRLINGRELPVDIKNWIAKSFTQAIADAGPRRWVVREYANLINAIGEVPTDIRTWILKSFVSMAKDEVGSYYTLCELGEIISVIGEIPVAFLRQEIEALCVDVSQRDDVTDDAICGIADIIDAIGSLDAANRQILVSRCDSFIEEGLVAYARLYGALCRSISGDEIENELLVLLECISRQKKASKLLPGIVDIAELISDDLTHEGKDRILRKLLEVVEGCEDPLKGICIYCDVCRVFYGDVKTSFVQSSLDRVIAGLNISNLGDYPIANLLDIFLLIDVECYDAKQRREIIESVLLLLNQDIQTPDQYDGIKDLCVRMGVELSREQLAAITEELYSLALSELISEPNWDAVSSSGYVMAQCQKEQANFSELLRRMVNDMKSDPQNTFLILSAFSVLEYHRVWCFDSDLSEGAIREVVSGFRDNELAIRGIEELSGLVSGWVSVSDNYLKVCGEPFLKLGCDVWNWGSGFEKFYDRYGYDTAEAMLKTTGKRFDDGREMSVWHDYVAGTNPLDCESKFTSSIEIIDGVPTVKWNPDLGDARVYTILGSTDLKTWTQVEEGRERDYNFFKVSVEMK